MSTISHRGIWQLEDIFIRIVEMPFNIKGYTAEDANGNYNIYINDGLSYIEKLKTYIHEMRHISGGHFDEKISAVIAEMEVRT
jgi:phosphoribosylaminoimidazole (AIR) synthetase